MDTEEHQHNFEVRYRVVNGTIEIDNPVKCSGCDKLAFVTYEGYKVTITLVPTTADVKYTVILEEEKS